MPRRTKDPQARRAALALLARGMGSPGEIAELAGVSRQVVEQWAERAKVDWRRVARSNLTKAWRRQMARKPVASQSKRQMRRQGERAKRDWDRKHGQNHLLPAR